MRIILRRAVRLALIGKRHLGKIEHLSSTEHYLLVFHNESFLMLPQTTMRKSLFHELLLASAVWLTLAIIASGVSGWLRVVMRLRVHAHS